jgi:benzoylformate decarboxylase
VGESDRRPPEPLPAPAEPEQSDPINPSAAVQALADVWPEDAIAVVESPSATLALRNRLKLSRPGSWYFGAGGGLGFGLPAAVGVQMAQPDRPVVCVIGEGSVQYAVQAFWTAAAYDVPLTVLVLRNEEYAILKWFAGLEQVEGAPGLDLPKLECAQLAAAYGVNARQTGSADETREALREAIGSGRPELIEVRVSPGMALG